MGRFKKEIKKDFTVVHNAFVRDKNLGINARGILITMLSLPEIGPDGQPWNFSVRGLASILPDGKSKIQTALNELEKCGYLLRRQIIEKGRFVDVEYIFSDEPMQEAIDLYKEKQEQKKNKSSNTAIPNTEKPYPENQDTEKQYPENSDSNIIYSNKINSVQISSDQSLYQSKNVSDKNSDSDRSDRAIDGNAERKIYTEIIKENIDYDDILEWNEMFGNEKYTNSVSAEQLDEIVGFIVSEICSNKSYLKICDENIPREAVKSVMLKVNREIVEKTLEIVGQVAEIKNFKKYFISVLYNETTGYHFRERTEQQMMDNDIRRNFYIGED